MSVAERFTRNQELLEDELDGELVGLSVSTGYCYGMNAVGTQIWKMLAQPCTLDELVAGLTAEFEIDPATCRIQAEEFMGGLEREGLVRKF